VIATLLQVPQENPMPKQTADGTAPSTESPKCGLVMPIATFGDYPQSHWTAVEAILREALTEVGFDAKLVSQETTSGVIHQRIITNLYTNDIVVCDVSARNPNVMFELGMRLAFDKPTIIVKDNDTPFSFDISGIEHLTYPRSLTYADIVSFKEKLGQMVVDTSKAAASDPSYSTFLKHVAGVKPARIDIQEVPFQDFLLKQLEDIRSRIDSLQYSPVANMIHNDLFDQNRYLPKYEFTIDTSGASRENVNSLGAYISRNPFASEVSYIYSDTKNELSFKMPLRAKYMRDISFEMERLGIEASRLKQVGMVPAS
jgi:hypothetical protein